MPRRPRSIPAGTIVHVLNRGNARQQLFRSDGDYIAFLMDVEEAAAHTGMRILAYCVMPNHWHFLLWARTDDDVGRFVHRFSAAHTRRWHCERGTPGTGHIYQGRYKSFPISSDEHFLIACRYLERNPLRSMLVACCDQWPWSSYRAHAGLQRTGFQLTLTQSPVEIPVAAWPEIVEQPHTEAELRALRQCVNRGTPYGEEAWRERTIRCLGLQSSARRAGRPAGARDAAPRRRSRRGKQDSGRNAP